MSLQRVSTPTIKNKKKKSSLMHASVTENVILHILFILMTIAFIYPVLLVVAVSFTDGASLNEYGYRLIPAKLTLDAYKAAIGTGDILIAYRNTILSTVVGTVMGVMINLMYAYPLSRKDYKRRTFATFFGYFTTLFGGGMVPWYILCTQVLHINNTFWALFLPSLASVWNVIILRTFITTNIPAALFEAAKIDGCSEFGIFFRIVVPLSKAGVATIGLFTALGIWNDYYLPMMLITKPKLYNLQYYLQIIFLNIEAMSKNNLMSSAQAETMKIPSETTRFAMCVLTMGPILFVYPFFQKYFVKGMVVGSVKG